MDLKLHEAASLGDRKGVERLLEKGADLNARNVDSATPLFLAVQNGHEEIVKLLLEKEGVDPDSKDNSSRTPLSWAAQKGYEEIVKLLLEKEGVDPDSKDNSSRTPLSWAAMGGHKEIVKLLLIKEGVDPDSKDNSDTTPLSWAATEGHEEVVKLLLEKDGVNPDSRNTLGSTPLAIAADKGHKGVVKLFLENDGIDPDSEGNSGRTPLSWAAQKGYEEVVKLLLEKEGVDPDSKDDFGRTPLSRAAQNGYEEVVKLLLEKDGVDSDSNDNDDVTPLSWAARYGHVGVAELLIARGAKYNSKDKSGHMPLWWATENLHSTVVKLLLEHSRITLHELVREGERTQICLLLSEGNIDSRNSSNQTPLHIAVLNEQIEIAEELLSRGADINAEDGQGWTCLRLAIDKKSPDLINLLLEYSADPRGIEYREWLSAYGKQNLATVWLTERCDGELPVRIVADREIPESLQLWRLPRKMLIFDPHSTLPWEKRWLKNAAAKLKISTDELPQGVKYSATASLPTSIAFYDGKNSPMPIGISWTMMPPAISNGESSWKSIAHLSVLPYGWMPDNGIEFFALFIAELERRWSALCDDTKSYLHTCRIDQLEKKGKSPELIDRLAGLARNLAEIRNYVQDQFHEARPFFDNYRRRYNESVRASEEGRATVNRCFENTTKKLDALDQTVRDLLQFEFAWVSINESFKSTSTATSTKRLSWVTFIFLPAMFASSLFGMNVNMLKDNPDWRWYIPVVATSLLLTITAWLIFKYIPIETWMEEWVDSFHQKLKVQYAVQSPMIHDKTKTNVGKTQTDDVNLLHDTSPV